jgi:hypothetical protein
MIEQRDPGDEQYDPNDDTQEIPETPPWLRDNPLIPCPYVREGLKCKLSAGHSGKHESPELPYFCYVPDECWGRSSCPRRKACSS